MRCVDEPGRSLKLLRLAVLATISVAAVSCSSDTQRFQYNLFGSRTQASSGEVTGSVPPQKQAAIQSAPLPPPNVSAPQTRPAVVGTAGPVSSGAARAAHSGWNWEGGTAITVQKGDTIDGLVTRYGVPDQHQVAVGLELIAGVGDDAVLGGLDRRAFRHRDVDAVVLLA